MKSAEENLLGGFMPRPNMIPANRESPVSSCVSVLQSDDLENCPPTAAENLETEVVELFRNHALALSRYASTLARDNSLVPDAVQEAFLRYFMARTSGQQMENARAWLFRVLRNYLLDCKRKAENIPAINLEKAVHVADIRQDVEAGYQQNECFLSALSILSPREKECVQLRLEGFGYNEIADILRIRPGTVAALLARGLKKIQEDGKVKEKQRSLRLYSGK